MENKYNDINKIIEIFPYIKGLANKVIVIKYGGNAMNNQEMKINFLKDVVFLKNLGAKVIVVHGGGPNINLMLKKLNIESKFLEGNRITDDETMEIVEMVLSGKVNKDIVSLINGLGGNSIGMSGKDGNLITVKKKYIEKDGEKIDIGNVGEIVKINLEILNLLIKEDYIPVISSIGVDTEGKTYNINADYVASSIASTIKAEKFIFVTNISGIRKNVEDAKSKIDLLTYKEGIELINKKIITDGMIPKIQACLEAIKDGVEDVHIINGEKKHSMLIELLTESNIGTKIIKK